MAGNEWQKSVQQSVPGHLRILGQSDFDQDCEALASCLLAT